MQIFVVLALGPYSINQGGEFQIKFTLIIYNNYNNIINIIYIKI